MNACAATFESNRSRMFGVAYRLLGSRNDADDVLQDAYLNWCQCAQENIQSATAFLVTITKRLCFDRLRKLKHEREHRVEWCLPEPAVEGESASAEVQLEAAQEVSVAFVAVLERLGPEERAAFLLHDVFDYDYPEVAQLLGKTEATCRQVIHRARVRVRDSSARFSVTAESLQRLLGKFIIAMRTGDRKDVMALLAEDVECVAHASEGLTVASSAGARRSIRRRLEDNFERAPLCASAAWGANVRAIGEQPTDRACGAGYVCPGRAQSHGDQGTGVYEMDNETYQMTKVA